jgi:hypothetical protein
MSEAEGTETGGERGLEGSVEAGWAISVTDKLGEGRVGVTDEGGVGMPEGMFGDVPECPNVYSE